MDAKFSKANENIEIFNTLIDEMRINEHERVRAKARLAQGEAMANAFVGFFGLGKRLLKALSVRPVRRPTTSAG